MEDGDKSTVITLEDVEKGTVTMKMEKRVQFTTKDGEKSPVYHEKWRTNIQCTMQDVEKSTNYHEKWRKEHSLP